MALRTPLKVNGARGVTLLGFSVVSFVFGLAFNSPVAVIPPPPAGLAALDGFIPLPVWGLAWYLSGVMLLVGAFRQDQSKSMSVFAGLLTVWAISYAVAAFSSTSNPRLLTIFILQTAIYGGLLVACLGVARLINAPQVDIHALRKKVRCQLREIEGNDL